MLKGIKKIFGLKDESEEITMVADIALGQKKEPGEVSSRAGIVWRPDLQAEWDKRFTRCSGCGVWIRGKRSVWCEVCGIKGF